MSKNQSLKKEFSSNMNIYFISFNFISFLMWQVLPINAQEPEHVCSRFTYEEQTLGKMARVEVKMEQWDKELKTFEESILSVLANRREEMTKFAEDLKLLDEMKNIQDRQDKQFEGMSLVIAKQKRELEEISIEVTRLREESLNKTKGRPDAPIVAFNAYITDTLGKHVPKGEVLKFPNVLLNEGRAYDAASGYFKAPISGLYQFFAHMCHQGGKYMVYAIYYEDKIVSSSTAYESRDSSCASTSTVIKINKDEKVCVKSENGNNYLFSNMYRWPSFIGVLLYTTNE